ncbi:MAG: hypothetical protein WD016_06055 [Balneolaceae bacterium]
MIQKLKLDPEYVLDRFIPFLKRWGFSIICIPFCWILLEQFWMALKWDISFSWRYPYPFFLSPFFFVVDNFLLIIHEAGHTIFGLFGYRFLAILGGTLMEILLPFLIFVYGWYNRNNFTAQLGLLLTAFAWIESAAYAADALFRRMPLIGNLPKSAHDFYNMFTQLDILGSHMTVAWIFYIIGCLTILLFIFYPLFERKKYEYVDLNLKL